MKSLRKIVANILEIEVSKLNRNSSAETISEWDSVNNLILISEIEKEYNVVITITDVYNLKNLGDVYDLIKKRGGKIKL